MSERISPETAVSILREILVTLIRKDGPALSSHQLAVYLTCYMVNKAHTVRGLAADLNVSKSVITRALDKLGELDLARRQPDPADRRSIIVERTAGGTALLDELKGLAEHANNAAETGGAPMKMAADD